MLRLSPYILVVGTTVTVGILLYVDLRKRLDIDAHIAAQSEQEETHAVCATKGIRDVLIYHKQSVFIKAIVEEARK